MGAGHAPTARRKVQATVFVSIREYNIDS